MLENIANAFGMERKQICMVGDRLDTDILFGQDGGLSTMLVLSGVILIDLLQMCVSEVCGLCCQERCRAHVWTAWRSQHHACVVRYDPDQLS